MEGHHAGVNSRRVGRLGYSAQAAEEGAVEGGYLNRSWESLPAWVGHYGQCQLAASGLASRLGKLVAGIEAWPR